MSAAETPPAVTDGTAAGIAYVPVECEHHWKYRHKPGHLLHWVAQCSLCHEVNWDELDREVRELTPPPLAAALDKAKVVAVIGKRTGLYGHPAEELAEAIIKLGQDSSDEEEPDHDHS